MMGHAPQRRLLATALALSMGAAGAQTADGVAARVASDVANERAHEQARGAREVARIAREAAARERGGARHRR